MLMHFVALRWPADWELRPLTICVSQRAVLSRLRKLRLVRRDRRYAGKPVYRLFVHLTGLITRPSSARHRLMLVEGGFGVSNRCLDLLTVPPSRMEDRSDGASPFLALDGRAD